MSEQKVSLVTMVRNVEDTLPFMLESALPYVDRVVALMVGPSEDKTADVLKGAKATFKEISWDDDFSLARNRLFDFARRRGVTWALLLDGDDNLENGEALLGMPERLGQAAGAMLPVKHFSSRYHQKRVFNLKLPGSWTGRAHETYASAGPFPLLSAPSILHVPGAQSAKNVDRNITIFRRWLEEAPEEWDGHVWYNYANELYWHSLWAAAAEAYGKSAELSVWDDERYLAYIKKARSLQLAGLRPEAWPCLTAAAKIKPHWQDAYFEMSRLFYYEELWELAVEMDQFARGKQEPDTYAVRCVTDYTVDQCTYMSYALGKLGRIEEALRVTEEGLQIAPKNAMLLQNQKWYTSELDD